jgi:hypothetical protein
MVGGLNVPPIGPCSRTLYPASPSQKSGPLGLGSPPSQVEPAGSSSRYYVPLRLPTAPLVVLRLSLVPRYLACFLGFRVSVAGSLEDGSGQPSARAFGHPVPHSGNWARRQVALPSSRVTPVKTCPVLRPRWCPSHSPKRVWDCCLPVSGRRLSPPYHPEGYPALHHYIHISGLNHAACLLAPSSPVLPLLGVHVEFAPDLLARR